MIGRAAFLLGVLASCALALALVGLPGWPR